VGNRRRYIINGKFLRAGPTGVHRVAAEMTNALADLVAEGHPETAGCDFELCYPYDAGARAAELRMQSRLLSPLTHIPWEQITLPLAKGDATLINLCNIGPAFVRNAVTMVHDAQVHLTPDSYSPAFRLWYKAVQGSFARRNRLLLTVSDYSRNQLVDAGLGSPDRIAVVHNGVDHAKATPADPAIIDRLGLNASPFTVALASTQAHKNIRVLLEAYARPALADTSLVLFGSEGPEAFAAAGMRVPQNVVFAGRISDGELRCWKTRLPFSSRPPPRDLDCPRQKPWCSAVPPSSLRAVHCRKFAGPPHSMLSRTIRKHGFAASQHSMPICLFASITGKLAMTSRHPSRGANPQLSCCGFSTLLPPTPKVSPLP